MSNMRFIAVAVFALFASVYKIYGQEDWLYTEDKVRMTKCFQNNICSNSYLKDNPYNQEEDRLTWNPACHWSSRLIYRRDLDLCLYIDRSRPRTWDEASNFCKSINASHLLTAHTKERFLYLKQTLEPSNHMYWLGGELRGSSWTWLNGQPVNDTDWLTGKPDKAALDGDSFVCAGKNGGTLFGLADCENNIVDLHYSICEY